MSGELSRKEGNERNGGQQATYVIPPALGKVGELVLEGHLPDFEHDGEEQAEIGIAQQQRLGEPAHDVRQYELVVHRVLEHDHVTSCSTRSNQELARRGDQRTMRWRKFEEGSSGV